jgi:hypothetical protein
LGTTVQILGTTGSAKENPRPKVVYARPGIPEIYSEKYSEIQSVAPLNLMIKNRIQVENFKALINFDATDPPVSALPPTPVVDIKVARYGFGYTPSSISFNYFGECRDKWHTKQQKTRKLR